MQSLMRLSAVPYIRKRQEAACKCRMTSEAKLGSASSGTPLRNGREPKNKRVAIVAVERGQMQEGYLPSVD